MKTAGCTKVYSEKMSGARSDRPQLAKAIAALQADDVFVVCKLDRLARSTKDLLVTLEAIKSRGAGFKVLDNPALGGADREKTLDASTYQNRHSFNGRPSRS